MNCSAFSRLSSGANCRISNCTTAIFSFICSLRQAPACEKNPLLLSHILLRNAGERHGRHQTARAAKRECVHESSVNNQPGQHDRASRALLVLGSESLPVPPEQSTLPRQLPAPPGPPHIWQEAIANRVHHGAEPVAPAILLTGEPGVTSGE